MQPDDLIAAASELLAQPPAGAARVERIGAEFGAAGEVHRITWPSRAIVVKRSEHGGERELRFFEELAHGLKNLPAFLGGTSTEEGAVLLFEEVEGRQGDVLEGCSEPDASALLRAIGRIHRHFLRSPEPLATWPRRSLFKPELLERARPALQAFREAYSGPEALLGIPDRGAEIDAVLDAGPQTLIHADFHLDNVIFDPDPVILDWQTAAVGPPEIDLVRFQMEGLTVDQREAYGETPVLAWSQASGLFAQPARMLAAAERSMVYLACAYARPGFGERLGARGPALRIVGAKRMLALWKHLSP